MKLCTRCGAQVADSGNYCCFCGTSLNAASQPASVHRKRKKTRRAYGSGTIKVVSGRAKPYLAFMPNRLGREYIGAFETMTEASETLALRK